MTVWRLDSHLDHRRHHVVVGTPSWGELKERRCLGSRWRGGHRGETPEGCGPLGNVISVLAGKCDELIQLQVNRAEAEPDYVPVGLLPDQREASKINQAILEHGAGGLLLVGTVRAGRPRCMHRKVRVEPDTVTDAGVVAG